jgi:uncharacterized membrane protein
MINVLSRLKMDTNAFGWIGLIVILFVTTFGIFSFLVVLFGVLAFTLGLFTLLYLKQGDVDKFYNKCAGNPLTADILPEGGLNEVVLYYFCDKSHYFASGGQATCESTKSTKI